VSEESEASYVETYYADLGTHLKYLARFVVAMQLFAVAEII
jgi:hypothetical protein